VKRYSFGKFVLDIPDDHKVRDIHREDYLYDRLYDPILDVIGARNPSGVLLDIGANVGDSAAFMATYLHNPIVSVEGAEAFLPSLRGNAELIGPQVKVIERFVSSPLLRSHRLRFDALAGTGSLRPASTDDIPVPADRFISVTELLAQAHEFGPSIALVKSDTDGFDGFLLPELLDLTDCPICFECDLIITFAGAPTPWPNVFRRLTMGNYGVVVFDNVGLPLCATNSNPGELLADLSGNIHMQYCVGHIRTHYIDVWAFPPSAVDVFHEVTVKLRQRYLKPFGF
jgi:FkbM family methyltransferase